MVASEPCGIYWHPSLQNWGDLLTPGSITCFVCLQSIPGRPTKYAAHLVEKHYSEADAYRAQLAKDAVDTVVDKMDALQIEKADRKSGASALRMLSSKVLCTEPARFLLKDLRPLHAKQNTFQLVYYWNETKPTVRIANQTTKAQRLALVLVFNTRTTTVLNSAKTTDFIQSNRLHAGKTFEMMIPYDVLGTYRGFTIMLAFSSATDKTLTWEYHQLNFCCVSKTGENPNSIESIEPRPLNATLYAIMKPTRDYAKLANVLQEYKSPSFYLTADNYVRALRVCSNMDEIEEQLILDSYRCYYTFKPHALYKSRPILIKIPKIEQTMPELSTYDSVLLSTVRGEQICETPIKDIIKTGIIIEYEPSIEANQKYSLSFRLGSKTYDLENSALDWVARTNDLLQFVFPSPQLALQPCPAANGPAALDWQNVEILSNAEQMQAVQQVVLRSTHSASTAAPFPYLLFGPPGTGKTKTLIEAVYQVLRANTDARILLCTSSNAAADDLMLRLMRILPDNRCPYDHIVYRVLNRQLRTPAQWRSSVGTETSDARMGGSKYWQRGPLSAKVLRQYSVIVCTLTMSGLLPGCKFTDVFIDECGSATESATLVALQSGCTGARMTANVVLAGDPKQLGPVLKSDDAIAIGYGKSLLERLMSHPAYARDATTNRYPAHMVTKLVRNYRSHAAIIAPSNRLFYDNELQAVGPPQRTQRFLNWSKLPNPLVPIIFHAMCKTWATQGHDGRSWSNRAELDCVAWYIRQLLNGQPAVAQRDIAVITPYRRQLQQMVRQFATVWPDVVVSSVERFQGRESPVVLVSTVRSRQGIGFLRNQKRLNVLLTRAQGLQIVVGNPLVLLGDRHWRNVLTEWKQSGVCVGDSFELNKQRKSGKKSDD